MKKEVLAKKLSGSPLYSKDGLGKKASILARFYLPFTECEWLITEADEQPDGDWLMFGYCHITEWEWGYVSLNELLDIEIRGLKIQMDMKLNPVSVGRYLSVTGR